MKRRKNTVTGSKAAKYPIYFHTNSIVDLVAEILKLIPKEILKACSQLRLKFKY